MAIKAGTLFKKSNGHGLFKRYNWTPRYCTLTCDALNYYDHQDGHLKGSIDLSDCDVDALKILPIDCPKDSKSLSTEWRISIQTRSERFFIATMTEREMYEWALALEQVLYANQKLLTASIKSNDPLGSMCCLSCH